tara:strand:+ start:398 stop:715 length:318 start_codon:yes stop_codon:yes gene_type:complete
VGIFGGTIRSLFNCCSTLAANEFAAGFTTADDPKVEVGFENIGVLEVLAGVEVGNGLDFGDVPFLVGFAKGPAGVNVSFAFLLEPNVLMLPIDPNVFVGFAEKPA